MPRKKRSKATDDAEPEVQVEEAAVEEGTLEVGTGNAEPEVKEVIEEPVLIKSPALPVAKPSTASRTRPSTHMTPPANRPRGTVTLRYSGESPVKAVANVPSGTRYRIQSNGLVTVYAADVEALLANEDFKQI
jgi:hypothetical protein